MAIKEDKNGIIRDELGQWVPGQSGNPDGRRPEPDDKYRRRRLDFLRENTTDDDLLTIWKTTIAHAKAGETSARRDVFEVVLPDRTQHVNVNSEHDVYADLTDEQIDALLNDYANGDDVPTDEA
jgi:hypothetical protein